MAHSRKKTSPRQAKSQAAPAAHGPDSADRRSKRAIAAVLVVLVGIILAAYWPVLRHGFFDEWDDPNYVTANSHVQQGLTAPSIAWAFRATDFANWFPLTWLSHMLDCQLFRLDPMGHHLTSLLLHVANALMLFAVLRRMTGEVWPSCVVAGLFALHPLHVESVAWVAERKDVLSTLFALLSLWAYARYAQKPGNSNQESVTGNQSDGSRNTQHSSLITNHQSLFYLLSLSFFACGLMSKPMVLTLPLLMLLLDFWPLRRVGEREAGKLQLWGRLLVEKLPLLALSAASAIITFLVQSHGGAVAAVADVPLQARLANVPVAYVSYLARTFFPVGLSPLYPFDFSLPAWRVAGYVILLGLVTVAAVRGARRYRYLLAGWLWYVIALIPVIGLVQVGGQAMADRYTYLPLTGIFIIVVWGTSDLARRFTAQQGRGAGWPGWWIAGTMAVLLCLATASRRYLAYWQNSSTLFSRALAVNEASYAAHFNLGLWLATKEGKRREAAGHFRRAADLNPRHAPSRYSLGLCLAQLGDPVQAAQAYREALAVDPGYGPAHRNLALLLERDGKWAEAFTHYEAALKANPEDPRLRQDLANAHSNFGAALAQQGKLHEAESQFLTATRLNPSNTLAQANLAITLYQEGRYSEAWQAVEACRQHGGSPPAALLTNLSSRLSSNSVPSARYH